MIRVSEDVIERDIDRAVAASKRSDSGLWLAGFFAHRVWRTYEIDAMATIAQQCGKDKSTVENWCHAYELYNRLRRLFRTEARQLRKALTPSHFWTAWELQRKYALADADVIFQLEQMVNYKAVGQTHGVSVLRQEVEAEQEQQGRSPTWDYYLPKLRTLYVSLLAADVPENVGAWLADAPEEVKA